MRKEEIEKEGTVRMKKVGVVICNYNKADAVLECIQCILDSKFRDFDLYVVDNASTDGSAERIREKFPTELELIVNPENLGGSGGFNAGLRAAYARGYSFLMCVDNDAMLDENAIGNLFGFLEEHQEVGMAGSKIYHLEEPAYIQQFGQKIDFEYFCTEVPHLNMYEDGSMPDFIYTDSVAACSLMIRREVIDKVGFMPEENFLYWDDTEWCYLCHQAGYEVASVGTSKALHAMGAKKETVNTFPTYYAWRNWISFFVKYTPEERLEKMAETFLSCIFQIVYDGLHTGERNRVRTVMMAYDDAVHGVTGKAGPDRIFPLDFNEQPYRKLFAGKDRIFIEENGFPVLAERVRCLAEELGFSVQWCAEPEEGAHIIALCSTIFEQEDLSRQKTYIDINDCILDTEDDVLDVINFNYSKRAFLYAQKPLFLCKVKELRKKMGIEGVDAEDSDTVYNR